MIRKAVPALLAGVLALAAPAALAHHSFAMFDASKNRTIRGTVAEFRWANPHVALFIQLEGTSGPNGLWAIEMTSPGNLRRLGWSRTTLQPGTKVDVSINPLRDGRRGGGFRSVTFLDTGKTLTARLIEVAPGK